jgi:hypothetical protein
LQAAFLEFEARAAVAGLVAVFGFVSEVLFLEIRGGLLLGNCFFLYDDGRVVWLFAGEEGHAVHSAVHPLKVVVEDAVG